MNADHMLQCVAQLTMFFTIQPFTFILEELVVIRVCAKTCTHQTEYVMQKSDIQKLYKKIAIFENKL